MARSVPFLVSDIVAPTKKTSALNTRYLAWWYIKGHRQHTAILELYEKWTNGRSSLCWESWNMGGYRKSPCICSGIRKQYSQHQRYPMVIEFYEKNSDCNERKEWWWLADNRTLSESGDKRIQGIFAYLGCKGQYDNGNLWNYQGRLMESFRLASNRCKGIECIRNLALR